MTDRRIGQTGPHVDFEPANEQQIGTQALQVDYAYPKGVQSGQLGFSVDLVAVNTLSVGSLWLMVDYVAALITGGIGWSGTAFVASGGTPVLWGADAFQTAGAYPPVQWDDGAFTT